MNEILNKIYNYTLEEIMGTCFGKYSKEVIQNRAIPDIRDGLKPVQRRIIYGMMKNHNTYDNRYQKSAESVGYVMGNLHPHGDSSIYEAMVRLSQEWKQNHTLVDMSGNNGSMDGDPAAAYRYTEARLSKIASELLKDIEKDTVLWIPNYNDKLLEPTVLPARFPNLLVNGANGISSGYATNIPPHNLGEIIDATILLIEKPSSSLEEVMEIVKAPDFPTGGIILGSSGIKQAYETGRGKIFVRGKVEIEKSSSKNKIIIHEIPYDVNKQAMVKRMSEIMIDKLIDGISEVRDETGLDGLKIVIELKKEADTDLILNYLYKNTELQISYNFNMISICDKKPMLLGIIPMLEAYIKHEREVVTKKFTFDLNHAKQRYHIVEGLIKAISILDEIIKIIRASKDKADSIKNLVDKYNFSQLQADAIVTLQLYRLSNTDITVLEEEKKNLELMIKGLTELLENPKKLDKKIIADLEDIKKKYAKERITKIEDEYVEIKIDTQAFINKEDVIVVVTKDGYVKRVSERSFLASNNEEMTLKENDYIIGYYKLTTLDTLLLFTDYGNYLYIPVHLLPDLKYKEMPKHINSIIEINTGEKIIQSYPVTDFNKNIVVTVATAKGMIKRVNLSDFKVVRYSKPLVMMKLKEDDKVVSVVISNETNILVTSNLGYGLWYDVRQIPLTSLKASGVKNMALKNDLVTNISLFSKEEEYLSVITDKGSAKRIKLSDLERSSRAKRGLILFKEIKSNPSLILKSFVTSIKNSMGLITNNEILYFKNSEIKVMDRYSSLSSLTKSNIIDSFITCNLEEASKLNDNDIVIYSEEQEENPSEEDNIKELKLF